MTFDRYWAEARRRLPWLAALMGLCVGLALVFYTISSDVHTTTAVVTSKQAEASGFDLKSISGLASLAGGGQRPSFEQLTFSISSEANIRQTLPALLRTSPPLVDDLLRVGPLTRLRRGAEDSARALFGKPPVIEDRDDRLIEAIGKRLKVSKTPEGYLRVNFSAIPAAGQLELVSSLLATADKTIRDREALEYRRRVAVYQGLIDQQQRPSDLSILVSLMSREYATYVAAQSGEHFSFSFVEPPVDPRRVYATSLLALVAIAMTIAVMGYLAAIFVIEWRNAA